MMIFGDLFEAKVMDEDYDELSNKVDDKVMKDANMESGSDDVGHMFEGKVMEEDNDELSNKVDANGEIQKMWM